MYSTYKRSGSSKCPLLFLILDCKTLQALSFCVKIEVTEIERKKLMKFLELNKNAMRSSISLTNRSIQRMYGLPLRSQPPLAPTIASLGNLWSFVKNAELAKLAYGANYDQVMEAPVTIALFTDTDLQNGLVRLHVSVGWKLHRRAVAILYAKLPAEFALWCPTNKRLLVFECRSCGYELGIGFDGPRHWNQYYFGIW